MSVPEKIGRLAGLTALAHSLALARIRAEHPEETVREHKLRLAARWLPPELMLKAFGWAEKRDLESP